MTIMPKFLLFSGLIILLSCVETSVDSMPTTPVFFKEKPIQSIPPDTTTHHHYSWLTQYDDKNNLLHQIPVPQGFKRTMTEKEAFGDWLRHLPLKPENSKVFLYNGEEKRRQYVHARVIDIDTGQRDLQQCADATMRLKAEYHYSQKEYNKIHFNYTSGDRVAFSDWAIGKKPVIRGNKVVFSTPNGGTNYSYANFKKYLQQIFSYAGTASLSKELRSVSIEKMNIGDVFIQGGFPGHAVIVVDMAENEQGEKLFLLAQSYMPAQDIHVLKNPTNASISPWYELDFGTDLATPEWRFTDNDLKRWE